MTNDNPSPAKCPICKRKYSYPPNGHCCETDNDELKEIDICCIEFMHAEGYDCDWEDD